MAPQRPSAARIEAGHELTASGAGDGQVLVSLREAAAELLVLLGKVGHLLLELADVIGLSEAGLAPDLLAERFAEALFEAADLGGEAGGAGVGSREVGLNDLGSDWLWSGRVDIDGPGVRVGE